MSGWFCRYRGRTSKPHRLELAGFSDRLTAIPQLRSRYGFVRTDAELPEKRLATEFDHMQQFVIPYYHQN